MFKELDSRKLVIISASILMLMGFRWLSRESSVQEWKEQSSGFSYEMPRVSSYGNEFDLSGREIDRQIMSDEKKEEPKVANAKDAKKEDKKAKAKDAKKQAKKDNSKKKKEFDTKAVDTRSQEGMSSSGETENEAGYAGGSQSFEEHQKKNSKETAQNNSDQQDDEKDEKELSVAQWRALLSQTPSAENIAKLVKAHTNGKLSDQDFYGIVFEFFNESTGSPRYEAALAILGQDKSPAQFLYLAKNYGKVEQSRRSVLWNLMLGFAQAGRIAALNGALVSQDQGVVQMGLQVLKYAVDQQSQSNSQGPRNVAMAGPQTFVIFIGPLNTLTKQQNGNAQLAQTVLASIQALLNH